jgi:hypothetical protein
VVGAVQFPGQQAAILVLADPFWMHDAGNRQVSVADHRRFGSRVQRPGHVDATPPVQPHCGLTPAPIADLDVNLRIQSL